MANGAAGIFELTQVDADSENAPDFRNVFPRATCEQLDSDGDDVGDNADDFPLDPSRSEAFYTDGVGVDDQQDACPRDPSETQGSDGDGFGNNIERDYGTNPNSAADVPLIGGIPIWLLYAAMERAQAPQ